MSTGRPSVVRLAIRPPSRRPRSRTTTGSPVRCTSTGRRDAGDAAAHDQDRIHPVIVPVGARPTAHRLRLVG